MIWWVILLFVAGLTLVMAEFFVPGGICGAFGGAAILASCVLGWYEYPQYGFFIVIAEFMIGLVGVILGFKLFPHTPVGKKMILSDTQDADKGWVFAASDPSLLGIQGVVFTALRPAGTIIVDGRRIDAVSDGSLIEKGEKVRVIEVHGSRIVVEKAAEQ